MCDCGSKSAGCRKACDFIMMKKKLLSMLLSAVMVLTAMDFPALASEIQTTATENESISEAADETAEDTTIQSAPAETDNTGENRPEQETNRSENPETETASESSVIDKTQSESETVSTEETTKNTETEESTEQETETVTESETETEQEAAPETEAAETTLQAAYHTADEIREFLGVENAEKTDRITYAAAPDTDAPYSVGVLSDAALDSATAMVRQIRFIAGLPYDIESNDAYSRLSQSAAFVNYVNDTLSHDPSRPADMSEELFQQACEGAVNSSIAYTGQQTQTLNKTILGTWMADCDSDSISVLNNRRHILNPAMKKIGFGAVNGSNGMYSAMYTADCSGDTETVFGIAWPAQNMPVEYFDSMYPWSVSTGEKLNASEICVILTRKSDEKKWVFSADSSDGDFYVDNGSSTQKGCIIFRPDSGTLSVYADEDSFEIEITRNEKPYLDYTVNFFSLSKKEEKLSAPAASIATGELVAKDTQLILTSAEDADIYYTLDGTMPGTDSILYTEPLCIETDLTVKAIAVKDGYEDSDIAAFEYKAAEDVPLRYTVTFASGDETIIIPTQSVLENDTIVLPENPVKEGFLLDGWYKEAEFQNKWDFEKDAVTQDITLFAKWAENTETAEKTACTISFDLQGQGTPIPSIKIDSGELLTAPDTPAAEGYLFEGWYKESECMNAWDFAADIVSADIILYAKWTEEVPQTSDTCTVVFDMQGIGTQPASVSITNGELLTAPDAPTAEGYAFAEWYRESECVNAWNFETDIVTEDTILYAKWVQTGTAADSGTDNSREAADEKIDLSNASAKVKISSIKPKVYDGSPYEPALKITAFNGKKQVTLKKDIDYTLSYKNNVDVGENTGIVTVTGKGSYTGSVERNFTITHKSVKKLKILTESKLVTDETAKIFVYDGAKLLDNALFTFTYIEPANPKKAKVTVAANDNTNYKGSVTVKLTVYDGTKVQLINSAGFSMNGETVYTSKAITRNITVKMGDNELKKNKDYKVQYQNNINAGTAYAIITGKGKYKGKVVLPFNIAKANIAANPNITIKPVADKIFSGKEQRPAVTVKIKSKKFKVNNDYKITYLNNLHCGTATIQINGTGTNLTGNRSITFEIKPQHIKKASVKVTKATDEEPSRIVLTYSKNILQEYCDYKIKDYKKSKGKKVKVTIKGIADFKGEVVKSLKTEVPPEEPEVTPAKSNNINRHNYLNFRYYGLQVTSNLFRNQDGTLTRVEFVDGKGVYIEGYTADSEHKFLSQKLIKAELPIFGGFYASNDNYFLVFGQENPEHDDNTEVIRFVKYDKNWNRLQDARLYGINTEKPFNFSSVRMADHEGVLYVRTGHNMYSGHQANMAFSINIADMKFINQFYTLGGPSIASHSLNQYITLDDPYLVTADHGDAYPRGVLLAIHFKDGEKNTYFTSQKSAKTITALKIGIRDDINVNHTGVSVGGLEATDTSYLVAGNSVDQTPETYDPFGMLNIFVSSTPKNNFKEEAVKIHWITNYSKFLEYKDAQDNVQKVAETAVYTPHLVKINNSESMLMWTEVRTVIEENKPVQSTTLKSVLLNADGEPASGIYTYADGRLSDCKPILIDGSLVWYYTANSEPVFCTLNVEEVRKQPR